MDTNKTVNQPEKDGKKRNKFVTWWLGLNKWAKVGICAGTAAVLATAITLPIVLTRNKIAGTFNLTYSEQSYVVKNVNLKKGLKYEFKVTIDSDTTSAGFGLNKADETAEAVVMSYGKLEGITNDWKLCQENTMLASEGSGAGFELKAKSQLVFTVSVINDVTADAKLECGGAHK